MSSSKRYDKEQQLKIENYCHTCEDTLVSIVPDQGDDWSLVISLIDDCVISSCKSSEYYNCVKNAKNTSLGHFSSVCEPLEPNVVPIPMEQKKRKKQSK